jgi:hypothetical protein
MPTYIVYYSQGSSNGPFDIYLSGSSGLNLYASNIQKYQLVNGYQVTFPDGVPSSSIDVFDISYGCFTDQNVPFPTPSPTVTPTISITPSKTPTISFTPTATPTISLTPTATPSFTPPPTATPTLTPTISSTPINSPTPTISVTVTRTPSPTAAPSAYSAYGSTQGYDAAYQACYTFNTVGFNGITLYFINPPAVGGRAFYNSGAGLLTFNGFNLWYAIGSWASGFATAYRIDTSGFIMEVQYPNCILV